MAVRLDEKVTGLAEISGADWHHVVGTGLKPKWLVAELRNGKKLESFAIKKA